MIAHGPASVALPAVALAVALEAGGTVVELPVMVTLQMMSGLNLVSVPLILEPKEQCKRLVIHTRTTGQEMMEGAIGSVSYVGRSSTCYSSHVTHL